MKIVNGLPVFTYGNKNNQPIVFVHGFTFDNTMWNNQVEALKDQFYCITYDIRGLGKSEFTNGQFTLESFVDDLFLIIDELDVQKPILAGLSMGGYIALRAVERNEEIFKALILFDTRADSDTNLVKLKRAAGIKQIDTEGLGSFIDGFIPNCFSSNFRNTKQYEEILNSSKRLNPIGVKGCLLAMQGRTSTREYLSNISIPTLVLCGEFDALTPVDEMRAMSEKIHGSNFIVVPGAGHLTPVEQPESINAILKSFIGQNR
jgi:pimeloyl-ACP methyl ester carboxylesterase